LIQTGVLPTDGLRGTTSTLGGHSRRSDTGIVRAAPGSSFRSSWFGVVREFGPEPRSSPDGHVRMRKRHMDMPTFCGHNDPVTTNPRTPRTVSSTISFTHSRSLDPRISTTVSHLFDCPKRRIRLDAGRSFPSGSFMPPHWALLTFEPPQPPLDSLRKISCPSIQATLVPLPTG
jgi:hypothetical protein